MNRDIEVIRVSITKLLVDGEYDARGRWQLMMSDADMPEGLNVRIDDPRIIGMVELNKSISRYLREILSMIEDELPEEG